MLELGLDAEPDQQTLAVVSAGAHALAYIVIATAASPTCSTGGSVRCHCRWRQSSNIDSCPPRTPARGPIHAGRGWEPAGDVGGDTFDFSVERDTLHLSITDAMATR